MYREGMDSGYIPKGEAVGTTNQTHGAVSVWNRKPFAIGITENDAAAETVNEMFRSAYRATEWIATRTLT